MSNFDFLRQSIPEVHQNALKTESALRIDASMVAIYARITLEQLVDYLYRARNLQNPYGKSTPTLVDRLRNPEFQNLVRSPALHDKMRLIRLAGNKAAHGNRISGDVAMQTVRDLHHLLVWAARYHSPYGSAIDPRYAFEVSKVPQLPGTAPQQKVSQKELIKLAEELEQARETHQTQLAAKEAENKALQERLAELEAQLKNTFTETTPQDIRDYNEADTRAALIDVELELAGWDTSAKNLREVSIPNIPIRKDGSLGTGKADYVLWGADGKPLAVIEAKRASRDSHEGERQAELYAQGLYRMYGVYPVIITTNGTQHKLWDQWKDSPTGKPGYQVRSILAFPTRNDLERMHARRRAQPLNNAPINQDLVDRKYQINAVRSVGTAFDAENRRRALLVMATGAGKTRISMAIVKMLSDAGWVKNTLFLADRVSLVNQAVNAFRSHFKTEMSIVNLLTDKDTSGRVYGCTYPTIMNQIEQRKFSPGFFDLIVIDEAHRSVYAKYKQIFEYFDALLVGLTATPKDDVDHDTYELFGLNQGEPTDYYSLEQAVDDGYLVPPRGISLSTDFLSDGIHYDELSDDDKVKWDLIEWDEETHEKPNHIPSHLLNDYLFNKQTVDHVLSELMTQGYRVENGNKLGKTIIFAHNQNHANYIRQRFDALYPQYGGTFARVITHSTERAQSLIDDFSDPEKMPQIAVSVDMLDTGIDVPEVLNLVFFKPVRSYAKYWQMLGRGTRLCSDVFGPGTEKTDFKVFDCCGNLEFFRSDFKAPNGTPQKPQATRTFETTLALLVELDSHAGELSSADYESLRSELVGQLRTFINSLNTDSPFVRKHLHAVQRMQDESIWSSALNAEAQEQILSLAELGGNIGEGAPVALSFDLTIRKLQLDLLEGNIAAAKPRLERLRKIALGLSKLVDTIPDVERQKAHFDYVLSEAWGPQVSLAYLESIRQDVRGLLSLLSKSERKPFYTDFADHAHESIETEILLNTTGTVSPQEFEAKIQYRMRELLDNPAVQKARKGYALNDADMQELDAAFVASGEFTVDDILTVRQDHPNLGLYVRSTVGMDRKAVQKHLKEFIREDTTQAQLDLLKMLTDALVDDGTVEPKALYGIPYSDEYTIDYVWTSRVAQTVKNINDGLPQSVQGS